MFVPLLLLWITSLLFGKPFYREKKEKSDTEETTPKEEEEEAEKEPEVIEMTLDEYKAMQANVRSKKDFNLRRPGEGEDNAQWKKTYLLKKTVTGEQDDEDRDEVSCQYWD